MKAHESSQSSPFAAVSRAFNQLLGRTQTKPDFENVKPVDEVRAGLRDIKAGRVVKFKRAADLLRDE